MLLSALSSISGFVPDPEISGITQDSRKVGRGYLFAALPGTKDNGARYINDAISRGAAALLVTDGMAISVDIPVIRSANILKDLGRMAARFYGRQPEYVVGVTGTNGKTSTVNFCQKLWHAAGFRSASLGTLGLCGDGPVLPGSMTTPDHVSLHRTLSEICDAGVTHLAMEVSSHGLDQHRVEGVHMRAGAFTNLTRDHLDYHGDMADYFSAKSRLFSEVIEDGGAAVLNADIPEYDALSGICVSRGLRVLDYGYSAKAIRLYERKPLPHGQALKLDVLGTSYDIVLPLVGEFQAMNALCALGLALQGEADQDGLIGSLEKIDGVPGRLQLVSAQVNGAAVYVDYAHTPDALDNILRALRPHTAGRLFCLFGCGGDRDPGKRPIMGQIASSLADVVVVTDDNPRSENPAAIRAQIMKGTKPAAHEIGDRREAIRWAMSGLVAGDVLVVAGKGHEQGQIFADRIDPFDDVEETRLAIEIIKGTA